MNVFIAELKRRNVLRVAAAYLVLSWLLVQVGSVLLPTFEAPAWVLRVMVLLLAGGFVATLVFSWVYELTPEGLKRESQIDRSGSITNQTARKLDIAVIVLLFVAIGVAVLTRGGAPDPELATRPAAATIDPKPAAAVVDKRPSVAVLPFVNMSALAENEYFADGLSETLLNMLAQVSGLKVAARTSAFAFKGTKTDIREIARTLDVRTVLEGSVQRAGSKVRITAQLIDARDGSHLWSQSYDRTLDDIFAIQDEIATAVAAELTRSLMGAIKSPPSEFASVATHDAAAYDLYLRGLEQRNLNSYGSLPQAERLFKEALAQDPDFSDARIALARTYFMMADTGLLDGSEAGERGRPLLASLLKGAQPDPVAQAYDAILQIRDPTFAVRADVLRGARDTIMRALTQAPNSVELYELAALALRRDAGTSKEAALEIIERGLILDPLSPSLLISKGRQLRSMERFDEALAAYARVRELEPASPSGYNGAALIYGDRGPYVEAVRWYAKTASIDHEDHELPAAVAQYLLMMGLETEARPWVERAELLNASGSDTRRVVMLYAEQTGNPARAMALAADVIRERRDNRRFIYGTALSIYATLMLEAGKLNEAMALLRSVSHGIFDTPPKAPTNEFDLLTLSTVTEFLAATWSAEERATRVEYLNSMAKALFSDFDADGEGGGAVMQALKGNAARAAGLLADDLSNPGDLPWEWRVVMRSPALAQIVKEPQMVAAVAKLEADFAQQAIRYRELVAAGEIVVPGKK